MDIKPLLDLHDHVINLRQEKNRQIEGTFYEYLNKYIIPKIETGKSWNDFIGNVNQNKYYIKFKYHSNIAKELFPKVYSQNTYLGFVQILLALAFISIVVYYGDYIALGLFPISIVTRLVSDYIAEKRLYIIVLSIPFFYLYLTLFNSNLMYLLFIVGITLTGSVIQTKYRNAMKKFSYRDPLNMLELFERNFVVKIIDHESKTDRWCMPADKVENFNSLASNIIKNAAANKAQESNAD